MHGIAKHQGEDVVSVRVRQEDEHLALEVRKRNSRLGHTLEEAPADGTSLANTRPRLEHLYGSAQSFELRNVESGGVLARISIPLRTIDSLECVAREVV